MFPGNKIEETCKSLDLHSEERRKLVFSWEADTIPGGLATGLTHSHGPTDFYHPGC